MGSEACNANPRMSEGKQVGGSPACILLCAASPPGSTVSPVWEASLNTNWPACKKQRLRCKPLRSDRRAAATSALSSFSWWCMKRAAATTAAMLPSPMRPSLPAGALALLQALVLVPALPPPATPACCASAVGAAASAPTSTGTRTAAMPPSGRGARRSCHSSWGLLPPAELAAVDVAEAVVTAEGAAGRRRTATRWLSLPSKSSCSCTLPSSPAAAAAAASPAPAALPLLGSSAGAAGAAAAASAWAAAAKRAATSPYACCVCCRRAGACG